MKKNTLFLIFILIFGIKGQAQLVHPGISHKQSDLDRMKYMVEAQKEPWISTYNDLRTQGNASFNYNVRGDVSNTVIENHSEFINDGFAAYENALMWNITGDSRHAEKCIEIFNSWVNIRRIEDQFALNNGRGPWKMCEAAEIIKHTYDGWSAADQQKFADMLVYPGWSGTEAPTDAMASKDVSFYWNIYQGDRARHGNQGLFAYRSLMAMAIFLDNEIMYDRALNYLEGKPHRSDDLAYPSGPPITEPTTTGCEFYNENRIRSFDNSVEDYGYNEVLGNYIWENGQNHVESGDFIIRTDRSGRWESLKMNPFVACNLDRFERGTQLLRSVYEQSLSHYKDRMSLPSDDMKWFQRGFDYMIENIGYENGSNAVDYSG